MITVFITGMFIGICIALVSAILAVVYGRRKGWLEFGIAPKEESTAVGTLADTVADVSIRLMALEETLAPYLNKGKGPKNE